jgi:hypothetical protein
VHPRLGAAVESERNLIVALLSVPSLGDTAMCLGWGRVGLGAAAWVGRVAGFRYAAFGGYSTSGEGARWLLDFREGEAGEEGGV